MCNVRKTILAWMLILATLLCVIPVGAAETENLETFYATYVNPMYADSTTEVDITPPRPVRQPAKALEYYEDVEAAAAVLREGMVNRATSIQVGLQMTAWTQAAYDEAFNAMFQAAIRHTGVPNEGDYILRHLKQAGATGSPERVNGGFNTTWTFVFDYHSNYAHEKAVTEAVDTFIRNNITASMSNYKKFRIIYDWICDNVVYDYSVKELCHTAYAAKINKTAVCQGYANLLYRMLLEVGVDNRIISGQGNGGRHAWNIVKLGGRYYNVDATWDAIWHQAGAEYQRCLKNAAEFNQDHIRDAEFTTLEFNTAYPMADKDYDPATAEQPVSGHHVLHANTNVNWVLTDDLYLDLAGYNLTGNIIRNGHQIYGMDSTTDQYTYKKLGTFNCADENGNAIVPVRHWKSTKAQIGSIKRYMTIQTENGYTFHRFYLGITHISMKPSSEDVGFKAVFAGDDMVLAQLNASQAIGYNMHLGDENSVTEYYPAAQVVSGHPIHLWTHHFDIDHKSEVTLYAKLMLRLSDGTEISTDEVSMTVRSMMEQLDANYTSLLARQLQFLREMLSRHSIFKQWGLEHLFG